VQGIDPKVPASRHDAGETELLNRATALDAAAEGIAMTGSKGLYTYINPSHLSLFGYRDSEEVLGKSWHIFYTEEEIQLIERSVFPELLEKKKWHGRVRGHRKDKSHFIQELSLNLLPDGGIACICSDATERIEALEQRERLFAVSKSLLVICDFEGRIKQFNPAWIDLLGCTREEFQNRSILSHVYEEDLADTRDKMADLQRGIPVVNFTNRLLTADSRLLTLDWCANSSIEQGLIFASAHNITKRRVVEQSLKESEDNFHTFFETLDDMIFVANPDGGIVFANRAVSQKLGYSPEELRTMHLIDLHPAGLRTKAEEIVAAMFRKERDTCPLPLRSKSGKHLPVETRIWPGKWDQKDCLFGLSKDMTMLMQADEAREELLGRFLKIARLLPGLVCQFRLRPDGSSCFPFASDAIHEIYRVSPEEVREEAAKVFANIHTDDLAGFFSSIEKSARDLTSWQHEYRVKFSDGTVRALFGSAVPEREPDGSVLWHGFITDITERKEAADSLKELVDRLAMATQAGGVGIWDYDVVGNHLVWDDQMFRHYGITRDQFCGAYEAWTAGLHPEDRKRGEEEIKMALRGEKEFNTEFRVVWPDGNIRHMRAMAQVQRAASGEPQRLIGTNWDITDQKRAEEATLRNVARAEELTRLKSRFVSMASHELRTPLANVMLASELLKNFGTRMPADKSEAVLQGLVSSVTSMARTLDDLLLAGKIEDGKLACNPAPFDLLSFLRRCSMEAGRAGEEPSRIGIAFQEVGRNVVADERLLHHILKNLLENALKYSPADSRVEIIVDALQDLLTLSVLDRGIGVPEAERKFVFDAFFRSSNVGGNPGSGLGLFIAQKCAQAHGGQIKYTPQATGSLFSMTIPLISLSETEG